jgi:putative GTP pyrophosphokinase
MNKSEVDRLGERLRQKMTAVDLRLLDEYRREFRAAYDLVIDRIRSELKLETSGRPAKSTTAIVDKLRRGTIRLAQMQDVAGSRIVVADIATQEQLMAALEAMFDCVLVDRRSKPSHGYRAVHIIVQECGRPVEIQLRTQLQHAWAELSEKLADLFGGDVKYGSGPERVRRVLDLCSELVAEFEQHLDAGVEENERASALKSRIRQTMANATVGLRRKN